MNIENIDGTSAKIEFLVQYQSFDEDVWASVGAFDSVGKACKVEQSINLLPTKAVAATRILVVNA